MREPTYHQAFIPRARALLAAGYRCPCGCAAQPTLDDIARDLWVQSNVGSTPRMVTFASSPADERRFEEREPMAAGICRACGSPMEIAEYLAAFLALRKAPWPECDGCTRMVEH